MHLIFLQESTGGANSSNCFPLSPLFMFFFPAISGLPSSFFNMLKGLEREGGGNTNARKKTLATRLMKWGGGGRADRDLDLDLEITAL